MGYVIVGVVCLCVGGWIGSRIEAISLAWFEGTKPEDDYYF